ncbi:TIGR02594 family protein [Sphingomonas sp. BIUV-7]|uniref:TIGR02594 family protein n=1 Tax=Sphingomonas natans TaxID=3063330 RepID=A0ABT8YCQ5_9SPHN|nr:TIGR02594 family protein [Sphingomonas sp. BIUV-7]MDO6416136.1 TIGR02594 family protein [Sphingomonas sp. BIUV-7]
MSSKIKAIQQALKDKGFDPGDVDGDWGRKTIAALRAFQKANGLEVDGVFGPKSSAALLGGGGSLDGAAPLLVWFEEARRQFGTKETPGSFSNPEILEWAEDLDVAYGNDAIPWCGLFVAHCIGSTLTSEPLPNNPLGARNWAKFGSSTQPRLGAVMVFWRGSKDGFQGHVAFYAGEDGKAYHVLGGNQSDSVSIARIAKDRLLAARWPSSAATLDSVPIELTAGQSALSDNEA